MPSHPFARLPIFFLISMLLLTACQPVTPVPLPSATPPPPTQLPSAPPTRTITLTARPTATLTNTPSPTTTATFTPSPTQTQTASPMPTYSVLRGEVIVGQAVCHYGPGQPYLYKYGVIQGSNLEIIARDEPGIYVEVQAIGGSNPCWVKAAYFKIKGEISSLRPISALDVNLPLSPYYPALSGVAAARAGSTVTVTWHALALRAGDDSEQTPYVVEAWVCQQGQLVFKPLGSWQPRLEILDEAGCTAQSHARVMAAEKHGYTLPVEIDWPQSP